MKNEDGNGEQQEGTEMKCLIGISSKAYNVIYNPAKFQKEKLNILG